MREAILIRECSGETLIILEIVTDFFYKNTYLSRGNIQQIGEEETSHSSDEHKLVSVFESPKLRSSAIQVPDLGQS